MNDIMIRRSVRQWLPQPVEREKIEVLLRAAMQAPSARNGRPWEFLVISDPKILTEIASVSEGAVHCARAPAVVVLLLKIDEAPSPAFMHQDAAAAAQNILLQCVPLGLGGVWIGISPREERVNACRDILQLPPNREAFCFVALGYPADPQAHRFVDRFDPARIHWNHY